MELYYIKRISYRVLIILPLIIFLFPTNAPAVPYYGEETFTYHQPDGSSFSVKLYGDEFFAYQRTLDGYEVTLDGDSNYWCYAKLSDDGRSFESTGIPVVTKGSRSAAMNKSRAITLEKIVPYPKLPQDLVLERVRIAQAEQHVDEKGRPLRVDFLHPQSNEVSSPEPPVRTTTGDYTGICILVDFPDEVGTISTAQVDRYCNQPEGYTEFGNACSINEYYRIQSNGKLNFCNTVVGYVRMPLPKTYYDNNVDGTWGDATSQELVTTALNILMQEGFDFTTLSRDLIGFIYSINVFYAGVCTSGWSRGLWPHSWNIPPVIVDEANGIIAFNYQMTDMESSLRIGTFCHENGHMTCDFPDLYSYIGNQSIVGRYSLMCSSGTTHPRNIDPYLKYKAGWADVVEVDAAATVRALAQVDRNYYYKLTNPSVSEEYYLIENRDDIGYEGDYGGASAVAPGEGLVIWHVYEDGDNENSTLQMTPQSYLTPYELFIIEATPTTSYTPWYSNPNPYPNSLDTFYNGHGVDPLSDATNPELHFWDHISHTGRTVNSNFTVHSFGDQGAVVPYSIGTGTLSPIPMIGNTTTAINVQCDLGTDPADYVFYVYNEAGGTLSYTISNAESWLAHAPSSGALTTENDEITVTFSASGLLSGTYTDEITITAAGASNTPLTIPVTLTVAETPVLAVSPTIISESLQLSNSSNDKYFSISNTGGGSMDYTPYKNCRLADAWNHNRAMFKRDGPGLSFH